MSQSGLTNLAQDQRACPIPPRMAALPRDHRGYPIPVIVYRDSHGRAQFTINDTPKRQRLIAADACPICGQRLQRGRWFVGGPGSAFDPDGVYLDTGMHDKCAHYALMVCPYLAAPRYEKRIDDALVPKDDPEMFVNSTMDPKRPDVFVAVMAIGEKRHSIKGNTRSGRRFSLVRTMAPRRPYRKIEYWRHGVQLAEADALALVRPDYAAIAIQMRGTR